MEAPSKRSPICDSFAVLIHRHSDLFHSIWICFKTGSSNAILSRNDKDWQLVFGSEYVTERVGVGLDLTFPFSPRMFRQGNMEQFSEIIKKVPAHPPKKPRAPHRDLVNTKNLIPKKLNAQNHKHPRT